jgi:ribosomal-protein-alanine N-acetyltransferase
MAIEILVQQAGPCDAGAMAEIHKSCFAPAWDETAMAQFASSPDTLCLMGFVNDEAGGMLAGLLITRKAADEAELLTLGVAPSCRRKGLGRALLAAATALLRDSGARRLFLEVEEGNEAALQLYRSFGAEAVGRRPAYYQHGGNASIFSLAL